MSFPVGDMPGAVHVNRSAFDVELSGPPLGTCGGRGATSDSVPGYRHFTPAQAPRAWKLASLPAKAPGIVLNHSPASSDRYFGSPSLALLPNSDYLTFHRIIDFRRYSGPGRLPSGQQ